MAEYLSQPSLYPYEGLWAQAGCRDVPKLLREEVELRLDEKRDACAREGSQLSRVKFRVGVDPIYGGVQVISKCRKTVLNTEPRAAAAAAKKWWWWWW